MKRLPWFVLPCLVCSLAVSAGACGGKTVVDGAGASGGSNSANGGSGGTNSANGSGPQNGSGPGSGSGADGSSGSGMALTCDEWTQALRQALDEATQCNSCMSDPDPCVYPDPNNVGELTDPCGCPVAINALNADAAEEAIAVHRAWLEAGCVPLDCQTPCAVSQSPSCTSSNNDCTGTCSP